MEPDSWPRPLSTKMDFDWEKCSLFFLARPWAATEYRKISGGRAHSDLSFQRSGKMT